MKKKTQKDLSEYRRKASELKRLLSQGWIMQGTLSEVNRGAHLRHQLTYKVEGKTSTLYVPADAVPTVTEWLERWRQAREAMRELSAFSVEKLRGYCSTGTQGRSTSRTTSSTAAHRTHSQTTRRR